MSTVVIAMSGGVDSSVAAVLLKQQGHAVIGMMLRLWSQPGMQAFNRCCSPNAMALARRVAAKLAIPFYVIDAKEIFHQTVVTCFLEGYAQGVTPNPCLVCNRQIRWGFLLDQARAHGADFLATGHYVRLRSEAGGPVQILRAADRSKDQSYVLHVLTQDQLRQSVFPIGDYEKKEVRRLATTFELPVASRRDSQDLCFLAGHDYRAFIQRYAPGTVRPGLILTRAGQVLGEHQGLAYYTIGQRKGLGIASSRPLYVLSKDLATNALIVGNQEQLGRYELQVADVNWIAGSPPHGPFRAQVKIRYTAQDAWATVTPEGDKQVCIRFDESQRDITPGQAAVMYVGERLLGGGTIVQSFA